MGAVHLSAYSKLRDAEVTAVSTQSPEALSGNLNSAGGNLERDLGQFDFSKVKKFERWRELVTDSEVEIVDICLPTDMHAPVAIAALTAGKHVLCEKPMALTDSDCERMIGAAEENRRILMIGQVLRFWPEYRCLAEAVTSGKYGKVLSATFTRKCGLPDWSKWLPVEARSGGAVIDLLIHDIDQALMLFGMPQRVAAKKLGEVDGVTASLLYPEGPEVRIQGGWFLSGSPLHMSFQVRFERAEIEMMPEGLMLNDINGKRTKLDVAAGDGYESELQYFVECVRDGKRPDRCPPQDSAKDVKVALLIKQAKSTGEQVKCSD